MKFWGITGGIGSGKSKVLKILESKGYPVLDADAVARNVLDANTHEGRVLLGEILKIPALQGRNLLQADRSLDRAELRKWLVESSEHQKQLESLMHPAIRLKIRNWMKQTAQNPISSVGFIEASRMIESGLAQELEGVIYVSASESTRLLRVQDRDSKSIEEIKSLMKLQLAHEEFLKQSQYEISNENGDESLSAKLNQILAKLQQFIVFVLLFSSMTTLQARESQEWFASGKARSFGMAMTAFVDDHNALHVNPAGLALIEKTQWRFPDLAHVAVSGNVSTIMNKIKSLDTNSSTSIAEQLRAFDGNTAGAQMKFLSLYWTRPRMGVAVNPIGMNFASRIRAPSLLFAQMDLYAVAQGGLTFGYAQPFLDNQLRVGLALKPFSYRVGLEQSLTNESISKFGKNISDLAGAGWGADLDFGAQANLPSLEIAQGQKLELMAGLVVQNILANSYSMSLIDSKKPQVPANERRMNLGVAARLKTMSVLEPVFSIELRDLFTDHDEFMEFLHVAAGVKMKPRDFYSLEFRLHMAKTHLGGGMAVHWLVFDLEVGTYVANLAPAPGVGGDRRYYAEMAMTF